MVQKDVVLIDDSQALRDAFRLLVEGRGHRVAAFEHARDALDHLGENAADVGLIVLDLEMPGMDGFQFLAERDLLPDVAKIPVVVLTALTGPYRFAPQQVKVVLQKPVPSEQLLELIGEQCGAATGSTAKPSHKSSGVQPRVIHGTDFDRWYDEHKQRRVRS
jgi:CheY-like chemotaxis protein